MYQSPTIYFGVVCAVLVLAVVSFASAKFLWFGDDDGDGEPQFGPAPSINANECRADSVCEAKSIKTDDLIVSSLSEGSYICVGDEIDGQLINSPIPCSAKLSDVCERFDANEVKRIVIESTSGDGVAFREGTPVYKSSFVTVPAGLVLDVNDIYNSSSSFGDDYIGLKDPISGEYYIGRATSEGSGAMSIAGETYAFNYFGSAQSSQDDRYITLDYPQSVGQHKVLDLSVCF
ncbi:MAG TPA: hypothetical protein VJK07_01325 [Candidatus Nanoarchaeia archaeon]|nr:hypothetical protein [Candidatus Nanoarchaeia archaeon]